MCQEEYSPLRENKLEKTGRGDERVQSEHTDGEPAKTCGEMGCCSRTEPQTGRRKSGTGPFDTISDLLGAVFVHFFVEGDISAKTDSGERGLA